MRKLNLLLVFATMVVILTACGNDYQKVSPTVLEEPTIYENAGDYDLDQHDDDYISPTVIGWLGQDDLHPLVVSIFPLDDLGACPTNFHEWAFEEGIACTRFREGFEYRIDDILNSNVIESTRENVE